MSNGEVMHWKLPDDPEAFRQRLTRDWIDEQAAPEQAAASEARLFSAFQRVLQPFIGGVATTAVMRRANHLARQRYPWLGPVIAPDGSLDAARLAHKLADVDDTTSRNAREALLESLFLVLNQLLGSSLRALLIEVEELLNAETDAPREQEGL